MLSINFYLYLLFSFYLVELRILSHKQFSYLSWRQILAFLYDMIRVIVLWLGLFEHFFAVGLQVHPKILCATLTLRQSSQYQHIFQLVLYMVLWMSYNKYPKDKNYLVLYDEHACYNDS